MPRKILTCAVKDCRSTSGVGDKLLFCFPKERVACQKWVEFCQNPEIHQKFLSGSLPSLNYLRVCKLHFERESFTHDLRNKLIRGAVPTLLHADIIEGHDADPEIHSPSQSPPRTSRSLLPEFIEATQPSASTPLSPLPLASPLVEECIEKISLSYINMTRHKDLTPKKKKLFWYAKRKERENKKLKSSVRKLKMLLREASASTGSLSQVREILNSSLSHNAAVLLGSQLKSAGRKPNGRRWTLEEKLLGLALYKKSPKSYHLLRYIFTLPSRSSINRLLHSIPFSTGINKQIFASLSHSLGEMEDCDRICVLMFDEMSIMEHLDYNASVDFIIGFEDHGCNRRSKNPAKFALVFMVCGVLKKWKQPIAFFFSASQTKSEVIVSLMKEVLLQCHEAGLRVIATVCDMGTNNVKAMRSMGSSISHPYIEFGNRTIFTIFDAPHLLKATRNLFMAHNFIIPVKMGNEVVLGMPSWSHIQDAYKHAAEAILYRPIHRITEDHINPQGRKKMKVNLAAQVFSRSLAVYIEEGSRSGWLPGTALSTASFIGFIDELFDSMNADGKAAALKPLKRLVSMESPHFQFWEKAAPIITDWKMEKERREDGIRFCPVPPTQKGWLTNLNAFPLICMEILNTVDAKAEISTRAFNQDPLENLFGCIRGSCGSNTHPTATQFIGSLKSGVISGLAFSASTNRRNCEDDEMALLDSLRALIGINEEVLLGREEEWNFSGFIIIDASEAEMNPVLAAVCSQVFRKSETCEQCKSAIMTETCGPSKELAAIVLLASQLAEAFINEEPQRSKLCHHIVRAVEPQLSFQWLERKCPPHWNDIKNVILEVLVRKTIVRWCHEMNRK